MRAMTVLYDGDCPFCVRCQAWLARSPQRVPLLAIDCRSDLARNRYARIPGLGRELVVVDDEGRFWVGPAAFVMCLWALEGWSWLVWWMLSGPLLPLTIALFAAITVNRATLASLVGMPSCEEGHCGIAHAHAGPYR